MPVISNIDLEQRPIAGSSFGYSAARLHDLGATEYTLVSVAVDTSSSVAPFGRELTEAIKHIVQSCRSSARADNLLLRLTGFGSQMSELHGFRLLEHCVLSSYDRILSLGGSTALYDAAENAVSAAADYARHLATGDFAANGIVFVVTDGMDNASTRAARDVKQAMADAAREESLESLVTVLVGVNIRDPQVSRSLQSFYTEAGFRQYVEIERADAKTLARLAEFVSRSIGVQSQALGTGGPSQSLTF